MRVAMVEGITDGPDVNRHTYNPVLRTPGYILIPTDVCYRKQSLRREGRSTRYPLVSYAYQEVASSGTGPGEKETV